MPNNKMLIDAAHPEETRVVVLRGNKVEEFDFEAAERQQLRGNIYLAKVTRVEPSLQAAFVEYGGNRHGFLAFSEIHPDYYQIPVADRLALLEEQARHDAAEAAEDERSDEAAAQRSRQEDGAGTNVDEQTDAAASGQDGNGSDSSGDDEHPDEASADAPTDDKDDAPVTMAADAETGDSVSAEPEDPVDAVDGSEGPEADAASAETTPGSEDVSDDDEEPVAEAVEHVGGDALEEVPQRRKPRPRQYKIQEVIKRRQVLLVQVVKEERGNKGAALTTYLSLAGRYSVLMPNTARGGGISRKITNVTDRKRLKAIAQELEVPEGMGVILRTAGASRTKAEIKRDFEYLLRLWENVRELTLKSTAPNLVYEEGSLVKRSIRDLYSKDVDEVLVAGDDAYREAKDFMRMLMPSHARNVQPYKDVVPLFSRHSVEPQLDAMFSPQVTLKSGGYIVINQTEALVAIDVNSGRSTREHSIEDTALQTNLEAADEVARQLRLRDLAGLIVIDFIDMEERRNNRSVERKLNDCLKADRARIQVGRISHFGLLEMSRQRIRTGVLESSTEQCAICHGTGQVRSVSSLALQILRALEDNLLRNSNNHLRVSTRPDVALYVLNQKREHLAELEQRFGLSISVLADAPENGVPFVIERGETVTAVRPRPVSAVAMLDVADADDEAGVEVVEADSAADEVSDEGAPKKRKRRRRRRRGGEDNADQATDGQAEIQADGQAETQGDDSGDGEPAATRANGDEDENGENRKRRKRGRRGGRRRRRSEEASSAEAGDLGAGSEAGSSGDVDSGSEAQATAHAETPDSTSEGTEAGNAEETAKAPRGRKKAEPDARSESDNSNGAASAPEGPYSAPEPVAVEPVMAEPAAADSVASEPIAEQAESVDPDKPKRAGWWQRRSFF